MSFTPDQTQKIVVTSSILVRLVGFGFIAWIGAVGWIGKSLIDRVDLMTTSFNTYVINMERRVTTLESNQIVQNQQLQDLRYQEKKR